MARWPLFAIAALLMVSVASAAVAPRASAWFSSAVATKGESMSHGAPLPGVLDDGDLGNYQHAPTQDQIHPLVAARAAQLAPIAGDQGDVLSFRPNGAAQQALGASVLVTHRALAFVAYDAATGLFDVPDLGLVGVTQVTVPDVGAWDSAQGAYVHRDATLVLAVATAAGLTYPAGQHSGYITKGDHDDRLDQAAAGATPARSQLVQPAWVEGRLVRVVDQEALVWQALLGVSIAVLVGAAWLLTKRIVREGKRVLRSDAGSLSAPEAGRRCGECRAVSDGAFCFRCGAERAPKTRYALPGVDVWRREETRDAEDRSPPATTLSQDFLALLRFGRTDCEGCGELLGEVAFCLACGHEKHPRTRYASPEAREDARRRGAEERRR